MKKIYLVRGDECPLELCSTPLENGDLLLANIQYYLVPAGVATGVMLGEDDKPLYVLTISHTTSLERALGHYGD